MSHSGMFDLGLRCLFRLIFSSLHIVFILNKEAIDYV